MAKRYRHRINNRENLKIWTILCLVLVCFAAIALRGFIVYSVYPLEHKDEIKESSEKYSLDKHMVCAVIYTESHFDEQAVSGRGAVGLMQVMPATGAWAAEKMGLEGFSPEKLPQPEVNIAIGCWYLNYLTELFDGDMRKVLAGYNAGPNRVQSWINSEGALIDIPYEETEKYLEKVLRYYEIYKGLYKDF